LGCDVDDLIDLAVTAGPTWPVFVPYLSGERTPLWDLDVRALFFGLDEAHGRAEIAMSVLSGVFLAARHVLSLIEGATGEELSNVQVVGRGVGSPQWESIAVQSLGLPLRFHDDADMSARGAAILAKTLDGTSLADASEHLGAASRRVTPDDGAVIAARRLLARYRRASDESVRWKEWQTRQGRSDD
jgi:xylulokinase